MATMKATIDALNIRLGLAEAQIVELKEINAAERQKNIEAERKNTDLTAKLVDANAALAQATIEFVKHKAV